MSDLKPRINIYLRTTILLWVIGLSLSHPLAAEPAGGDANSIQTLKDLMLVLSESQGVKANFSEERKLSILKTPVRSEGTLYFDPPNRLARHTRLPGRSSMVVDGDLLIMSDEVSSQEIDLGSSKVARSLVNNFIFLLSGDLKSLQEIYKIDFEMNRNLNLTGEPGWIIELEPRQNTTRALVERIRIEGQLGEISSMETFETNGDRSLMTFSDVRTGVTFGPEELTHAFSSQVQDPTR